KYLYRYKDDNYALFGMTASENIVADPKNFGNFMGDQLIVNRKIAGKGIEGQVHSHAISFYHHMISRVNERITSHDMANVFNFLFGSLSPYEEASVKELEVILEGSILFGRLFGLIHILGCLKNTFLYS